MTSSELIRLALKEQTASHDSCCETGPAGSGTPTSSVGGAPGTGSRRTALLAGGIAAVLASACCLGPLLLVTVGVSGAWIGNLARLEPYRPIFIVIATDKPSQLFEYYLLDTNEFQPNIFTSIVPGINDNAVQTAANQANCGLRTIGSVRIVLEPKPGLPIDPNNPKAFIDVFTDVSGLFVINNESGCHEGWMIHDITVPQVAPPRNDGSGNAQFRTITPRRRRSFESYG